MGVKGTKSHIEKRGDGASAGMVLGYSRVTKRVKKTKTITQSKSYKRTSAESTRRPSRRPRMA